MDPKPRNYQRELEAIIASAKEKGQIPTLLLHSCCAPCSSYVMEYLTQHFSVTLYYYNPHIYPGEEYAKRIKEQENLVAAQPHCYPVTFLAGPYEPEEFFRSVKGHEKDREGGERCFICYELRLREAAKVAAAGGFDYFTTTLSISPLKNAAKLNEIGEKLGKEYGVAYLPSDFKKKGGYQRSVELSREYGLYRQNYCGCVYSREPLDTDGHL